MVAQAYTDVYLEGVEAAANTGKEPNQVWNQTTLCVYVGQRQQRVLGDCWERHNAASSVHYQLTKNRLPLPYGLLCSNAPKKRNRRMPNGTYGGVRGR